jgi:hypothetical protein
MLERRQEGDRYRGDVLFHVLGKEGEGMGKERDSKGYRSEKCEEGVG